MNIVLLFLIVPTDAINNINIPSIKTATIKSGTSLSSYGTIYAACILDYPSKTNYPGYFLARMYNNTFEVFKCFEASGSVEYTSSKSGFSIGIIYSN